MARARNHINDPRFAFQQMTTSKCVVCPGVKPVEEPPNPESKEEPSRTKLRKLMDVRALLRDLQFINISALSSPSPYTIAITLCPQATSTPCTAPHSTSTPCVTSTRSHPSSHINLFMLFHSQQLQTEKQRKNGLKGIIAAPPPGPSRPDLMGSTVSMQEVVLHTPVADLAEHCNSLNESAPVLSSDGSMAAILQGNRLLFLSGTKQDRGSLIVIPKRKNMDGTKSDVTYSYGPVLVSTVHLNQTHYNATPVLSATGDLVVVKNLRDYLGFSRRGTLLWRYRHRKNAHDVSDDTDDEVDPLDMFEWVKQNDVVGSLDNMRSGPGTHTVAEEEASKMNTVKRKMSTVTNKIGTVTSKVSGVTSKLSRGAKKISRVAPEPVGAEQTAAVAGTNTAADEVKVTPMTPTSPTSPTSKMNRVAPEPLSPEQTAAVVGTDGVEGEEQKTLTTPVSPTSPASNINRVAPEPMNAEQAGPVAGTDTAGDEEKVTPMTPTSPTSPSSESSKVAPEPMSAEQPAAAPRDPKAIFASFDGVKLVQPVPPDPYYGKPPPSSKRFIVARTIASGIFNDVSQKVKKQVSSSKKVDKEGDSENKSNETKINEEKSDDTNANEEKSADRDQNGDVNAVEDETNQINTNGEITEDPNTASEEQNNAVDANAEQNIDTIPIEGEYNHIDTIEGESKNRETEPNAEASSETKISETKISETTISETKSNETQNDPIAATAVPIGPPSLTTDALPTVRVRSRADFLLHSCTPPRVSRDGRLVLVKYEYDLVFLDGASGKQVGCIPTREMHIDSLPWVEADPYTEWGYLVCARDGVRVKMWHCILQEAAPATIMLLWEYQRPVGKVGRGIFPHAPRISANSSVVIFRWENKIISLDAQAGTVNAIVDCVSMNAHQGGGQVGMNDDASLVCCVEKQNIVARDGYTLETLWRHKVSHYATMCDACIWIGALGRLISSCIYVGDATEIRSSRVLKHTSTHKRTPVVTKVSMCI